VWAWLFLVTGVVFAIGEMLTPGAFFLAPFAVGGVTASLISFAGGPPAFGWLVFLAVSAGAFAAMRPLARRLDESGGNPLGVGAGRLVGATAVVLEAIPAGYSQTGLVRVGREDWRARTTDASGLAEGAHATVVEVQGTSVIVHPVGQRLPSTPPPA
jgi:membrane protein implicated in regulation of membrane protease activity